MQLVIESLSVCLIDDSANRDVPLLDLSLSNVQVGIYVLYSAYARVSCTSACAVLEAHNYYIAHAL